MLASPVRSLLVSIGLVAACAGIAATAGPTALKPGSTIEQRYQAERAACLSGSSGQERQACLREAAAARAEAQRGRLGDGHSADAAQLQANAMARCQARPEAQRAACEAMVRGEGERSGSVAAGAVIRSHVERVPAD